MYKVNIKDIEASYKFSDVQQGKCALQHNTGRKMPLLPYTTRFKKSNRDELKNFIFLLGELSRCINNLSASKKLDKEKVLSDILNKVTFNNNYDKSVFTDIIDNLFFDDSDNIFVFHSKIFDYIVAEKNTTFINLSEFIYSVFFDDNLISLYKNICSQKPDNMLYKLMLDSVKIEFKEKKVSRKNYKCLLPYVKEMFNKDFKFLLEDTNRFIDNFENLIKYYYFFYVSQLSSKLRDMFDADLNKVEHIYFNLDWESTSKSRTSYDTGWNMLESNIRVLFSHANCLELLNHCNKEDVEILSYIDIKNKVYTVRDETNKQNLINNISELISQYKSHVGDIDWINMRTGTPRFNNEILNAIYKLYESIDYQFKNSSSRNPRYNGYKNWFEEFCKIYFLKPRGPLGNTLNLTEEYLIFITRLCINNKDKIRLTSLFEEYERRGLFFDKYSKQKIIELFEKLNLLEKKSDSGDAQYVRKIL